MLSCRHATSLASLALDRPLSPRERLMLRGHLLICGSCRRMAKQFRRLRAAARRTGAAVPQIRREAGLSAAARERMETALRTAEEDRGAGGP